MRALRGRLLTLAVILASVIAVVFAILFALTVKPFSPAACFGIAGGDHFGLRRGMTREQALNAVERGFEHKAHDPHGWWVSHPDAIDTGNLRFPRRFSDLVALDQSDQVWEFGQGRCVFNARGTAVTFRGGRIVSIEDELYYDGL